MRETDSEDSLFGLLCKGRVDLAIAQLPAEPGPFAVCALLSVPWVLVVPVDAPIASSATRPVLSQISRLGAGVGAVLMPRLAVVDNDPRTVALELGDPLQPASIGLVSLRDRSLAARVAHFRDVVRQVSAAIGRDASRPPLRFTRKQARPSLEVRDDLTRAPTPETGRPRTPATPGRDALNRRRRKAPVWGWPRRFTATRSTPSVISQWLRSGGFVLRWQERIALGRGPSELGARRRAARQAARSAGPMTAARRRRLRTRGRSATRCPRRPRCSVPSSIPTRRRA